MAVTTDAFAAADLAGFIPEVWSPIVNREFFAGTVLASFCLNLSPFASAGGDVVHVPGLYTNAFSVQTQSTQGAEITTAGPAQDDNTLTINTHKYIAHIVGDKDLVQIWKSYNFNAEYAMKTGDGLRDALEDTLAALWSSLSTNTIGTTSAAVTDLNVRAAINKLDSTNIPLSECQFFFHPTAYWTQLIAVQKYYDMSMRNAAKVVDAGLLDGSGSARAASTQVANDVRGVLYGVPVAVSSNIVSGLQTYRNLLLHKNCFAFATQMLGGSGPVRIQAENAIRNLGLLTVSDIIYGAGVIREPAGCQINTSNSATVS